jgi:hypothetical protein
MATPFLRPRMFALALLVLGGIASAEDAKNPLLERIKRFKSLSDNEKAALRQRWKQFQSMPKEEQQALRERVAILKSQKNRKGFRKNRDKIARLKGDKRRDLQRKHAKMRRMMNRLHDSLPFEEQQKLAALAPQQRHEELRELFKSQVVERRISRLPEPLAIRMRKKLHGKSFGKSMETLRKAHHEYGIIAQKYFAKLQQKHGKQIRGIIEQSKRRGEKPSQLAKRFQDFLSRVSPKLTAERRMILAYMMSRRKPGMGNPRSPGRKPGGKGRRGEEGKNKRGDKGDRGRPDRRKRKKKVESRE